MKFLFTIVIITLFLFQTVFAQCVGSDYFNPSTGQCETNPETSMTCSRGRLAGGKCLYSPSLPSSNLPYEEYPSSSYNDLYENQQTSESWFDNISRNFLNVKSPIFWGIVCIALGIFLIVFGKWLAVLLIVFGFMLIALGNIEMQSFLKEVILNIINYMKQIRI